MFFPGYHDFVYHNPAHNMAGMKGKIELNSNHEKQIDLIQKI
tara:strand:- start:1392 stop:1517 length:126 start_codon:yes stop_codon:yes gene_type:complete